ncbi:8-amino-7-oxononanoate synthase [uncultured Porphyromonas sp.]|uniref:aminotransferase class I/II-fold pyridoxal phosphate-dependent enzyme n=1 Tax=uncultured Porphyromonas sp. TaxID=159274 RepID=UPI002604A122|nr:8-amino-7-oxononanoate synthase [uncultured Porphyromonas sp.]
MIEYKERLQKIRESGTYRSLQPTETEGKYVYVSGKKLLNLSSNDYLGLQELSGLAEEYRQSREFRPMMSSSSARLLTGNDRIYQELEQYLAAQYSAPSALVWTSGFAANSGIIPSLVDGETLFLADRLIHASMVEGLRLSGCRFARFEHNDVSRLRNLLERNEGEYHHIWVLVESVYSMDGDVAPLADIVALKRDFPSMRLYVDEAHSVGLCGHGLGLCAELGLLSEVDLLLGTLGKALGSIGAYSLQSASLREIFVSQARPFIYTTALPPLMVGWTLFLLRKVREMEDRRAHLVEMRNRLGLRIGRTPESQIISLEIPGEQRVAEAAEDFMREGLYVRPIRKPTVPSGRERLRISLTASMSAEEIDHIGEVVRRWM